MTDAERLRDALRARREAMDSGDRDRIRRATGEHLRIVGEILAARGGR